jgi:type I restriction enzyme S subunit
MKISYADYIKKSEVSVLVAEAIFHDLSKKYSEKKIEEVADTTSGGTPLRGNHDYYGGNIPWLKSGELNDGLIDKAEEYITEKGLANSSAKLHPEGTLLIAMYGATAGKTGITTIKTATNQAICAVFPKPCIDRDYLFWFFKAYRYKFIEISRGGAQPNISQTLILKTPLPLPEISIQKEIISILERVGKSNELDLSLIPYEYQKTVSKVFSSKNNVTYLEAELDNQNSLLTQLRQSFLREAMQGKLVKQHPKDGQAKDLLERIKTEKAKSGRKEKELPPIKPEEIPFELPENWVWCRLGDIIFDTEGGKSPNCLKEPAKENEWGVIKTTAVQEMVFLENENKVLPKGFVVNDSHKVSEGDLLITRAGPKNRVGIVCCVEGLSRNLILSDKTIRIVHPKKLLNSKFLAYTLNSSVIKPFIEMKMVGMADSQVNISQDSMKTFPIPLPSLLEQNRIVNKLDELLKLCEELQESIQGGRDQNELLLQQVLREVFN